MSKTHKSYRIKTTVNPEENASIFIDTDIIQEYDTFDILSLKINSVDTYKLHSANYGVVVGRVLANNGFGIPNAKLSIFIEADSEMGETLKELYPYTSTASKNKDGVRYNLLPNEKVDDCHKVVGTFPGKRYALDNDIILEVFEKYYKYTTKTNNSGDYLLMGVPVGSHTLHMDLDLSDCGVLSQRPRDFVYKGYNIEQFENPNQFKGGTSYDTLSHVFTQDQVINVTPFWGNNNNGDVIGITRADIDVAFKFEPTCVFIGSVISDQSSDGISKKCIPTENMGNMENLTTGEGTIEMIRKTPSGDIEEFQIKGSQLINGNGVWCYQIPMNLDYVMTDEYGNMVPTDDPEKGIPTRSQVRFRVSMQDTEENLDNYFRPKVLVPHNPQVTETETEAYDYEFGSLTRDDSFRDLLWNNVYTVKSYIPRFQKKKVQGWATKKFSGIKSCNFYGSNNPLPYNNMRIELPFMFVALCAIIKAFIVVVKFVNYIISMLGGMFMTLADIDVGIRDFRRGLAEKSKDLRLITISEGLCPDLENWYFAPIYKTSFLKKYTASIGSDDYSYDLLNQTISSVEGAGKDNDYVGDATSIGSINEETSENAICLTTSTDYLISCIELNLAMENKVINFDFYNDWINGTIYIPRFMRYVKPKRTFLGKTIIKSKVKGCMDDTSVFAKTRRYTQQCAIKYKKTSTYGGGETINTITFVNKPTTSSKAHKMHKAMGFSQFPIFGANGGICHEHTTLKNQHVYYMKPCEWVDFFNLPKKVNLFATDLVLLGSLNDCDVNGTPQAFRYLTGTSYILPTNLALTNMESNGNLYTNSNGSICIGGASSTTNVSNTNDNRVRVVNSSEGLSGELQAFSGAGENYDIEYSGAELSDIIAVTESAGIAWNYVGPGQGKNDDKNLYHPGGHFLGLACTNAQSNLKSCLNLSRICELGVNMSQRREDIVSVDDDGNITYAYIVPSGLISGDDIVSTDFRSMFATLNSKKLKTSKINAETRYGVYGFEFIKPLNFNGEFKNTLTSYYNESKNVPKEDSSFLEKLGISFDTSNRPDYDANEASNTMTKTREALSSDYYAFRMGLSYWALTNNNKGFQLQQKKFLYHNTDGTYYLPQYENSYYFYFGLKNGATAIDEFNKQFFAPCDNSKLIVGAPSMYLTIRRVNMYSLKADIDVSVSNLALPYLEVKYRNKNEQKFKVIPQNGNEEIYNNYMFTIEGVDLGTVCVTIRDANEVEITNEINLTNNLTSFITEVFDYNTIDGNRNNGGLIEQGGYMKISDIWIINLAEKTQLTLTIKNEKGDKAVVKNIFTNRGGEEATVPASGSGVYNLFVKYPLYEKNDDGYMIGSLEIKDGSDIKVYIGDKTDDNLRVLLSDTFDYRGKEWWQYIYMDTKYKNWILRNNLFNYIKESNRGKSASCNSNVYVENGEKILWGLAQNSTGIKDDTVYCSATSDIEAGWYLDDEYIYWPTFKSAEKNTINVYREKTPFSVLGVNGTRVSGNYDKWIGCADMKSENLKNGHGYIFKPLPSGELQYHVYNEETGYVYDDLDGNIKNGVFYPSIVYPIFDRPFDIDYTFYVWQNTTIEYGKLSLGSNIIDAEEAGKTEVTIHNGVTYDYQFHQDSRITGCEGPYKWLDVELPPDITPPDNPIIPPTGGNEGGNNDNIIDTPEHESGHTPYDPIVTGKNDSNITVLSLSAPSLDDKPIEYGMKHDMYGLNGTTKPLLGRPVDYNTNYMDRTLTFSGYVSHDTTEIENRLTFFEYSIIGGCPNKVDPKHSKTISGKTFFSFHDSLSVVIKEDGTYEVKGIGGENVDVDECILCAIPLSDFTFNRGLIIRSEDKYIFKSLLLTRLEVACKDINTNEKVIATITKPKNSNESEAVCKYTVGGVLKTVTENVNYTDSDIVVIEKIMEKCAEDIRPLPRYEINPDIVAPWKNVIKDNIKEYTTLFKYHYYGVEVKRVEGFGLWGDEGKMIIKIFPSVDIVRYGNEEENGGEEGSGNENNNPENEGDENV